MGRFPSGQRGQTVNLLAVAFDGSNPSLPISHAEVAQLVEQHLDMVEVVESVAQHATDFFCTHVASFRREWP